MKALVLEASMRLSYTDVPTPRPGPGEVLVDVRACGICGSDVHGMDGRTGRRIPPVVMGHEAAGVVAALGPDTHGWNVGDRVAFDSTLFCGKCEECRSGRFNLCDERRILGASTPEQKKDGAFAEYVTLPAHVLVRIPDGVSFEQAALAEPLSVALHAVARARTGPGESAVVVGTGVIGLLAVQALREAGVDPVIGIDLDLGRLELARSLGARHTFPAGMDSLEQAVREVTGGRGAHVAIEAVGIAAAIRTAIGCVRRAGKVVLVGNLVADVDIPLQTVITNELTLLGSCATADEYAHGLDLLARGAIDVEPLISAVAPLSDGADWFDRLHRAEPGLLKVILTPRAANTWCSGASPPREPRQAQGLPLTVHAPGGIDSRQVKKHRGSG